MNQYRRDLLALWTVRVYPWLAPCLSWFILGDLTTLDGKGYWVFFWPLWLLSLLWTVGFEIYARKKL